MLVSSTQEPFPSSHAPDTHSESRRHPRHRPASHVGRLLGHIASVTHSTHAPVVGSHIAFVEKRTQSSEPVQPPQLVVSTEQTGLDAGQPWLLSHRVYRPSVQTGTSAGQSTSSVHVAATHAWLLLHVNPGAQVRTSSTPSW